MRSIKFRSWNGKNFEYFNNGKCDCAFGWGEAQQFTGLTDKQGVEIYEGDIVALEEEDEDSCIGATFDYKCVVSYGNSLKISRYVAQYPSSFCVISKSFYMEQALLHNPKWQVKVIGNIYENADLLK